VQFIIDLVHSQPQISSFQEGLSSVQSDTSLLQMHSQIEASKYGFEGVQSFLDVLHSHTHRSSLKNGLSAGHYSGVMSQEQLQVSP
jgi:hypothetical protein